MSMKHTLILYEGHEKTSLFVVNKDLSYLTNVYIGEYGNELEQELNDLIYDENGSLKLKPIDEPTKDWTWFIKCGEV